MPTQTSPFQGIWIPLVTPFSGGAVDGGALRRLVRHYAAAGVDGLVVRQHRRGRGAGRRRAAGRAGRGAERRRRPARDDGPGRQPPGSCAAPPVGLGTRPLAGILAPAPYYVRPGQAGASAYFRCLADARASLALYDIPYRTGAALDTATLLELAAHPNIAAIKDRGGSLEKTVALIADGRLQVLAGEDLQTLSTLCLGGSGIIAAAAHIRPDLFVALYRAVREQRLDQARALFLALAPMIQLAFAEPNPGPVKAQLARQGLLTDELRAPMPAASAALADRLQAAVAELDRAFPPPRRGACRPRGWGVRQALSASDSFGNTCLPGC